MLSFIVDPKVLFLFWRETDEISLLNKLIIGGKKIEYILEDIRLSNKKYNKNQTKIQGEIALQFGNNSYIFKK